LKALEQPSRAASPDPYAALRGHDRPRSSSFSAGFRADLSSQRNLTLSALTGASSGRATPSRSNTSEMGGTSPLLASPSMASLASVATTTTTTTTPQPRSLYDSRQIAAAIDKFENTHKLDVRGGELGNVGAVGYGGDDAWQTVCVRVLPLWNGEGARGYIEDVRALCS
jgi:hypothetical protein